MNPEAIKQTKQFRKDLDEVLQRIKEASVVPFPPIEGRRQSRERSIAVTKIQEAIMWLGMDLKAMHEQEPSVETENPYPQSYNPESIKIEPTSEGLKL